MSEPGERTDPEREADRRIARARAAISSSFEELIDRGQRGAGQPRCRRHRQIRRLRASRPAPARRPRRGAGGEHRGHRHRGRATRLGLGRWSRAGGRAAARAPVGGLRDGARRGRAAGATRSGARHRAGPVSTPTSTWPRSMPGSPPPRRRCARGSMRPSTRVKASGTGASTSRPRSTASAPTRS